MEYRNLGNTGLQVSALGFGSSPLGGVFREIDEGEGIRAVHTALDLGVNFFDVSPYYGLTKAESVLGRALRGIRRDRYILATKVGRYDADTFDFSAQRVIRSVEESMDRLGVEVIDLIQCHDMEFGSLDQIVTETIPALNRLKEQGKVRFIGITGLPLKIFPYVLDRVPVDTILSYCHYTLFDQSLQELVPYLQGKGVGIVNASPLAMGLLTGEGAPGWHPAPEPIKAACARAAAYCRERGEDISRLAVQFSTANPDLATTLVGMADTAEVERNVRWTGQPVDQELLGGVSEILSPIHNMTWSSGRPENNGAA